jgi:hypothetical protein
MGAIAVEPEPPVTESRCERCAGTVRQAHGYVYEDGDAHGIYFVEWCDGDHPERAAFIAIGLGAFGEGSGPEDRLSFGIDWRAAGMALSEEPVRDRPELLGRFVPREEALEIQGIDHLWHIADHIVLGDERLVAVRAWLDA